MPEEDIATGQEVPEKVKDLKWYYHNLKKNWKTFTRPEVLAFAFIAGLCGIYYGKSVQEELVGIQRNASMIQKTSLDAYRSRLDNATPDQAACKIAAIQTQLNTHKRSIERIFPKTPRHLSEKQKIPPAGNIELRETFAAL